MSSYNLRIATQIPPEDLAAIFAEDEIIVAPVRGSYKIMARDENSFVDPDDFDETYSNETGKSLSGIHRMLACVVLTSRSMGHITGCHYIPFFSQPIIGETYRKQADGKGCCQENGEHHETLVACENLAMMLVAMGREVFVPVGIDIEMEDLAERGLQSSKLYEDKLPGYACHIYTPTTRLHRIEVINPSVVRDKTGQPFTDPFDDLAVYEKLSEKTPGLDRSHSEKLEKLAELHKIGAISRQSMLDALEKNSDYAIDAILGQYEAEKRREDAPIDSKFIKNKGGKLGKLCEECGKEVNGRCNDCGLIYGRRGWRELGSYDG